MPCVRSAVAGLVSAFLLLSAASASAGDPPADGKAVFASVCATCHGPAGRGGRGPAIAGKPADLVSAVVGLHAGAMREVRLSPAETRAVSAYVAAMR